ncbi:MAG: hypothetical protein KKB09_07215 [Nanoarchaeota archaeon]|nr:hypothetical protein [Nanoarchaeota archaeon]
MTDITTIPIKKETRQRLRNVGKKMESYDGIVNRLIEKSQTGDTKC